MSTSPGFISLMHCSIPVILVEMRSLGIGSIRSSNNRVDTRPEAMNIFNPRKPYDEVFTTPTLSHDYLPHPNNRATIFSTTLSLIYAAVASDKTYTPIYG